MAVNCNRLRFRLCSERQLAMERQLGELTGAVKALQARVAELSQPPALQPTSDREAGVKTEAAKDAAHRETGKSRQKCWW